MEQNETDRHWSSMGGLAELGRSVETMHCLLSFPWPLISERACIYDGQQTGEQDRSSCFHLMTSLYPRFVPASPLSDADRKLWNSFPFLFSFFFWYGCSFLPGVMSVQTNSNTPVPGVPEPVTLLGQSDTDELFSSSDTNCEDLLLSYHLQL